MTTNLLPQPTVGNNHHGPENDEHLASQAPTARTNTDPAGVDDMVAITRPQVTQCNEYRLVGSPSPAR